MLSQRECLFLRIVAVVGAVAVVRAQTPSDGSLRLTGGSVAEEGRLEVYIQGIWGAVCDDGFGPEEAGVACWQLGYGRYGNNFSTIGVDSSNPPILLDDLDCVGTEEGLDQCGHRPWGFTDCKDVEHVAVSCRADPCRNNSCQNNATCMAVDDVNVTCHCSPITTGQLCENFIDLCEVHNGGCSHQCINQVGSYVCACPDEGLSLGADGHTCRAPSVDVRCGRTMEVAFLRRDWAGLHEQYMTLSNSTCVATGNATHITLSVPLYGCGTHAQELRDGFVFRNQVMTRGAPVGGLVSRVRDVNMTVRCHYDNHMLLHNWYIVNSGQIRFSDVAQGHYQLTMDLFHNGHQYVGQPLDKVEPGEDLSIKFSLSTNDSSLQVFARNCKAAPTSQDQSPSQYLFLDNGCGKDPNLHDNKTGNTQETLQLQAFQFLNGNSSAVLVHCDVIVCNVTDPTNRCTQGCLTGSGLGNVHGGGGADVGDDVNADVVGVVRSRRGLETDNLIGTGSATRLCCGLNNVWLTSLFTVVLLKSFFSF